MVEAAIPKRPSTPADGLTDPWLPVSAPDGERAISWPDAAHDDRLAAELVHLIRTHPAVRRAVLGVVMSCPNIKWEL